MIVAAHAGNEFPDDPRPRFARDTVPDDLALAVYIRMACPVKNL